MKRIEFKSIVLNSVFMLSAGTAFVFGFVLSLFGTGLGGEKFKELLKEVPFIGSLMEGFVGSLIFGLVFGIAAGLLCALAAVFYNIFAMILGGIKVEIDDDNRR